jgi:hypothetical protein
MAQVFRKQNILLEIHDRLIFSQFLVFAAILGDRVFCTSIISCLPPLNRGSDFSEPNPKRKDMQDLKR